MDMLDSAEVLKPTDTEISASAENTQTTVKEENTTKESLLERLTALINSEQDITAEEVAAIKQQFYILHNEEVKKARAAFIEEGNAPEDFVADEDETETQFKTALAEVKDKKAEQRARIEAEQLRNLEQKKAIIEEIARLSEDTDNVNRHFPRVKELQTEFKETGEVPPQHTTVIWKNYQETVERFYDELKVNKELRDYDFKKNLGEKQLLIDEAKKLVDEPD
ncbi:MAG: DUF349 domain-containing protein, partial [Paramuribaculum sp.]|nr:DUF349 domain-containing protein [Paramuribaculum sp.]